MIHSHQEQRGFDGVDGGGEVRTDGNRSVHEGVRRCEWWERGRCEEGGWRRREEEVVVNIYVQVNA